jgi:hypothetical protein
MMSHWQLADFVLDGRNYAMPVQFQVVKLALVLNLDRFFTKLLSALELRLNIFKIGVKRFMFFFIEHLLQQLLVQ